MLQGLFRQRPEAARPLCHLRARHVAEVAQLFL
jgi:hypothetical protein